MPAKRLQAASYSGGESDTEWVTFQTQVKIQKVGVLLLPPSSAATMTKAIF
jgi:hypothetical protein